jgi:hypothetical protein
METGCAMWVLGLTELLLTFIETGLGDDRDSVIQAKRF